MSRTALSNVAALALALALSLGVAQQLTQRAPAPDESGDGVAAPPVPDASGRTFPVRRYARVVSASPLADQVFSELLEPGRVLAVTRYGRESPLGGWRHAGARTLGRLEDLEAVLDLEPDLVVVSGFADPARVARLRDAGLSVFDVGRMDGTSALLPAVRRLAALVGEPERGEALATRWLRRFRTVAADVPPATRLRGAYVGIFGDKLYGGTSGSSYGDVLAAAGVRDVAAEAGLEGWPEYTSEQLLALDPPVLVVPAGRREALCRHVGLDALQACGGEGRIVEVDEALLGDPGLGMLDAAEAIRDALYGPAQPVP
ncbi:MAG: ABC transporter substrate-binding protein [Myxococcota bacterium]